MSEWMFDPQQPRRLVTVDGTSRQRLISEWGQQRWPLCSRCGEHRVEVEPMPTPGLREPAGSCIPGRIRCPGGCL